jgi:phosphohistidine phosphatase SixA
MKRLSLSWLVLWLLLLILPNPGNTQTETLLSGSQLVKALQTGKYVVYFRHAKTDWSQIDESRENLEDCKKQRNLSERGRDDAKAIGQAFQALNIPVARVLASPYCRTQDTARLAFGRVEPTNQLISIYGKSEAERKGIVEGLKKLLSTPIAGEGNTVLVAHGFNIREAAGLTLAEGEATIFEPLGKDGFKLVGRVLPEEWAKLSQ